MRICGYCGTDLMWTVGEEKEARDNCGTGRSHDEFLCPQCGRLYCHIVSEKFDDVSEWWSVKQNKDQKAWEDLPPFYYPPFVLKAGPGRPISTGNSKKEVHSMTVAMAWMVTLLVSALGDIVCFELTGAVPLWLLGAKMGLLGSLILLSRTWMPITVLRPFFIMLLAITALMRGFSWVLDSAAWKAWQDGQSFAVAGLGIQLLKAGMTAILVGLLFLIMKRRHDFFLVRGYLKADIEPVRWLGQNLPSPLWRFGLVFTLVVIAVQFFMFILPRHPSMGALGHLIPLLPVILLLAVCNGFNEEVALRAAPISTVIEAVGKSHAIGMAAVLFGLAHYIGGTPPGLVGVLTTTFLGWFFGKCMVESKGLFWPWLFHAAQDILPFTLMALAAVS